MERAVHCLQVAHKDQDIPFMPSHDKEIGIKYCSKVENRLS
jgi:hypothetical protein